MNDEETKRHEIHSFYYHFPCNHFDSIFRARTEQIIVEKNELIHKNNKGLEKHSMHKMQVYFLSEEILTLSKMRIAYTFMQFEIYLKKLLLVAYNENPKNLYNWEKMISFLKLKNIQLKVFSHYQDVNDIRKVNNSIKHSADLSNKKTEDILEFKGKLLIDSDTLNKFYDRTANSPKELIWELQKAIDKNLFST